MNKKILVLAGDGIGQEVMAHALKVLDAIERNYQITFKRVEALIGGQAYDVYGNHFPETTQQLCHDCDAILFGSIGGPPQEFHLPKWQNCELNSILSLRKTLNLAVNIRPIQVYNELIAKSPLKSERINKIDFIVVRELTGDIYFGDHKHFIKMEY